MKAAQFLQNLEAKRQTKVGLGISIILEAALAYVIGSLAINSGSLFDYVLTGLLVILLAQDMVAFIQKGARPEKVDQSEPKAADKPKKGKGRS